MKKSRGSVRILEISGYAPICPHCGFYHLYRLPINPTEDEEYTCDSCGEDFLISMELVDDEIV